MKNDSACRYLFSRSLGVTLTRALFATLVATVTCSSCPAQAYKVTNIVSDGSVPATTMDPNFINPWAVSPSPTWWISTQGSGFNYVVASTGTIPFKVIVPAVSGLATVTGQPAGSVTTAGATGMILPNGTKASFLFSTLDGTISGWNSKLGTANAIAQIAINNSTAGASYPGLAIVNTSTRSYILAANFGTGNAIEVYDDTFKPTKLAGTFTDPNLPAGYTPFSVHLLGSQVFVAYALRSTSTPYDSVDGVGNGVLDVFDTAGNFVARAITGGNLNSPWGVAFAPANFGIFSNDLLVGNEGDGLINVYDPKSYAYLGQLMDSTGKSLAYDGLWELLTGGTSISGTTAVSGGDPNSVYLTAGLTNEAHGLFAGISSSTGTGAAALGLTTSPSAITVSAGSSIQLTVGLAPVNGFSGAVTLACTGLPAGATCTFSPAQITVSPTSSATSKLTLQTAKATASLQQEDRRLRHRHLTSVTSALLLPLGFFFALRRRRSSWIASTQQRLLGLAILLIAGTGVLVGCGGPSSMPGTPVGQSNVSITATAASVSQQTSLSLTVK